MCLCALVFLACLVAQAPGAVSGQPSSAPPGKASGQASGRVPDRAKDVEDAIREGKKPPAQAFSDFRRRFNRSYNPSDERVRQALFLQSLRFINDYNAQLLGGAEDEDAAWMALGSFADLSSAEFSSSLNVIDWRAVGAVAPVKDQGTCGSCWAFAATSTVETANKLAGGRLYSLSEQQLLDCGDRATNNCGGGYISGGWDTMRAMGGATADEVYPYRGFTGTCDTAAAGYKVARVAGWAAVTPASQSALLLALQQGSVAVGIASSAPILQHYGGGVIRDFGACCTANNCHREVNHAVVLVGANLTGGYYILRNSWGPGYGEGGYFRLAMGTPPGFPYGMCGILSMAQHPVLTRASAPAPPAPEGIDLALDSLDPASGSPPRGPSSLPLGLIVGAAAGGAVGLALVASIFIAAVARSTRRSKDAAAAAAAAEAAANADFTKLPQSNLMPEQQQSEQQQQPLPGRADAYRV